MAVCRAATRNGNMMIMDQQSRPLAVVTAASTGIGLELAKCCAQHDFDLVIAADNEDIEGSCGARTGRFSAYPRRSLGVKSLCGRAPRNLRLPLQRGPLT